MQRKAYGPGVAALLVALLAGCTGGSDDDGESGDAKAGDTGTTSASAQPGRYRTLPEPCGAVSHGTLDNLLPGLEEITDEGQRERVYAGDATLTYDTDRKVGCRWKVESATATDHLLVDFERVVSYDTSVSDDSRAAELYASLEEDADLPEPTADDTASGAPEPSGEAGAESSAEADKDTDTDDSADTRGAGGSDASDEPSDDASDASDDASGSASPGASSTALQPRTLDGLGDEAFLDDEPGTSGPGALQRTVTVVFRTSNVIVTIEYEEQSTTAANAPASEEMQDRARKLAAELADSLDG
ncbi:DUF3558 domain-containing protein [Streptomyces minutiscleroticus]|uniref:DUF3558 domain-containing protein n=1 Tax=Streptomyces minutiscleroticus TaxID=68238 RepID=UPI00332E31A0